MKADIVKFFNLQRQIFGVCPSSGELFRLSECKVYLKTRPTRDWLDKLDSESDRLDRVEERIDEKEEQEKEKGREKGRREANLVVKKIDRIFSPRKLNPDDAKVVFHPIDYIVFNGMHNLDSIKNIVFLDRKLTSSDHRRVSRSIETVVNRGHYEWLTLRVQEDGSIKEED